MAQQLSSLFVISRRFSAIAVAGALLFGTSGGALAMEKSDPEDPFGCKEKPENCLPGDPPELPGGGGTPDPGAPPPGGPDNDPGSCASLSQRLAVAITRRARDIREKRTLEAGAAALAEAVTTDQKDEATAKTALDSIQKQVADLQRQLAPFASSDPQTSPTGKPGRAPTTYDTSDPRAAALVAQLRAALRQLAVASARWRAAHALTVSAQAQSASSTARVKVLTAEILALSVQIQNLEKAECSGVSEKKGLSLPRPAPRK